MRVAARIFQDGLIRYGMSTYGLLQLNNEIGYLHIQGLWFVHDVGGFLPISSPVYPFDSSRLSRGRTWKQWAYL